MKIIANLFLIALACSLPACATRYSAEPIAAVIIDTETNQPVEGVVVVAHWQLDGGLEGGSNMGQMMVMEAVTDNTGKFNFPAWGPKEIPGGLPWYEWDARLKDRDPELLLFKSGYRYLRLQNQRTMEQMGRKTPSVRTSDWNGKTIKMEKFKGNIDEYSRYLSSLDSDLWYSMVSEYDQCAWKNISMMIAMLGKQTKIFEAANIHRGTFYDRLTSNDEQMVSKGCGSVKELLRGLEK